MEQNNEYRVRLVDILKVIVILLFFVGFIVMGVLIHRVEFSETWKFWVALVIGEIAYLYSAVFVICAIAMIANDIEEGEIGVGMLSAVVLIGLSVLFQLIFWGVVFGKISYLIAIVIVCAIILMPIYKLIREGREF